VKKVLVIRFSSIGDIVLTTPVIRVLKERSEEEVEVHFLLKEPFAGILRNDPNVDVLHTWNKEEHGAVLSRLQEEQFDHVVDLQGSLRSLRVRRVLGRPSSTFPKLNMEKWLLVNLGWDRLPRKHVVDRYFEALRPLGLDNDGKGAEFHIPPEEEVDPSEHGVPYGVSFVVFSIGGAHATKRLPEERIIELCRRIELPVVLLGGKEDRAIGERVAREAGHDLIDRCGELSIPASASFIRQSRAVLTHDTGMMHIAAALERPVLSFWGNTVPAFGMYPYMPGREELSHIFQVNGLSCRPCSKLGHDRCPKGHFRCMWDIDLDRALATLDRILRGTEA
jgi:ADP-heptose:LPS heptosyltransferase